MRLFEGFVCPDCSTIQITDTDRVDWLESHPVSAEVFGGPEDGHTARVWAVSSHSATLRETLDLLLQTPNSEKSEPLVGTAPTAGIVDSHPMERMRVSADFENMAPEQKREALEQIITWAKSQLEET